MSRNRRPKVDPAELAKQSTKPAEEHPIETFRRILVPYDRIVTEMLFSLYSNAGVCGPDSADGFRSLVNRALETTTDAPELAKTMEGECLHAAYMLGLAMGRRISDGVR